MEGSSVVTYLRVQIIHPGNGFCNIAALKSFSYVHTAFDAFEIDPGRQVGLAAKLLRRRLVPLDDEVIHNEAVQVPEKKRG